MACYTQFFGVEPDSLEYTDLLQALNLSDPACEPVTRKFGKSTEYRCFYPQGIALCFESGKLDSIDFYKEDRSNQTAAESRYNRVDSAVVPEFLGYEATGVDLVTKFGEPLEKGGGMGQKMDIWMRWKGFQVEVPDRNWDTAKDVEWCSLTIYHEH